MVFLIEARFDRIRTSYRQKTKAATQPESESADGFAILSEFWTSNQILESDTRSYRNRNRKIPIASSERKISDNNLEMLP